MANTYNPDKTMVVLKGLICLFVALSASILGSIYYVQTLGLLGFFPSAGLWILDLVIAWSVYIDYKEDGTPLEWASWVVMGIGTLYLICYGSLLAYSLTGDAKRTEIVRFHTDERNRALADCLKAGGNQKTCREQAPLIQAEMKTPEPTFAEAFIASPASKIIGPLIALLGVIALTAVRKITKPSDVDPPLPASSATLTLSRQSAPFIGPSGHSRDKTIAGAKAAFRFRDQGGRCRILLKAGGRETYIKMTSWTEGEILAGHKKGYRGIAEIILTWNINPIIKERIKETL